MDPHWQPVIFAADCASEDAERELLTCAGCGEDYGTCPCPGPNQEDLYEYQERNGILYARKLNPA